MMGLAGMAMSLAERRAVESGHRAVMGFWTDLKLTPCDRGDLNPALYPISAEYYAILDRISRGEPA
jgi:hypothetical protein